MAVFRSIVFIAALAGLVAGLAMTGMQYAGTVPLILKAETFEADAPAHDHGAGALADGAAAHEHEADGWAPADGFERSAYTALGNVVTSIGFRAPSARRLRTRGRACGMAARLVLGTGGLRGVHLGAGPRPAARIARDACRGSDRSASVVGRNRGRDQSRPCAPRLQAIAAGRHPRGLAHRLAAPDRGAGAGELRKPRSSCARARFRRDGDRRQPRLLGDPRSDRRLHPRAGSWDGLGRNAAFSQP